MRTGFLYEERFLDHDAGRHHPERKERLESTMGYLRNQPWFDALDRIEGRMAERRWVEAVHTSAYIERAREACRSGHPFLDVVDVGICESSYEVAMLAAGSLLALCDSVTAGDADNAFALTRPPGHHAERDLALGFCVFNNIAVAARYLQRHHGVDKVLILDWDVHHGNGTQHSFESDPSVMYVSTHQYPFYPGTGAASETGTGKGAGTTVNCPMPAGAGDTDYERAFKEQILPAISAFAPEFVLISAGFDAHRDDPLAGINLSTDHFRWMSQRMLEVADQHCDGRLVSILEGGYNIERLPECVGAHLEVLAQIDAGTAPGT